MSDLRKKLEHYNLGVSVFATMIGASKDSLYKYETGEGRIRESTREKVERGLKILEDYNLVAPHTGDHSMVYSWYMGNYDLHTRNMTKYKREFKKIFEESEV